MKVILSFDYELFFGEKSGSPEKCMIEPSEALAAIAADYRIPLCFFVDAGYLAALRRFMAVSSVLRHHEAIFRRNLDMLSTQGHELLLHVHPHWEDAIWNEDGWKFDLTRFCLSDFDDISIMDIVKRYTDELRPHARNGQIHAYRAGGWAVQPFAPIGRALHAVGVYIDSTVFPGGRDVSGKTHFDFTGAPLKQQWRFETDPAVEEPGGMFLEIPTSSMTVSPLYYWRLALIRLAGRADTRPFGDGGVRSMPAARSRRDKLNKLLNSTLYCVTLDGMKASLAAPEYRRARKRGTELLVLLSHPKMMTPFALGCLRKLLEEIHRNGDEVVGYGHYDNVS